jgi:hypothetical protein
VANPAEFRQTEAATAAGRKGVRRNSLKVVASESVIVPVVVPPFAAAVLAFDEAMITLDGPGESTAGADDGCGLPSIGCESLLLGAGTFSRRRGGCARVPELRLAILHFVAKLRQQALFQWK